MPEVGPEKRPDYSRALIAGSIVVVLLVGGGSYLLRTPAMVLPEVVAPLAAPGPVPVQPVVASPAVVPAVPATVVPSFDVVRVSPSGSAVIAGRAAPGAEVVVRDGGVVIARAQADGQGAFVAVPGAPLAAGGRSLTLAARGAASAEVQGDGAVVVVVPAPAPAVAPVPAVTAVKAPAAPATAVVVLVPSAAPPRMLQEPRQGAGAVGLDSVDYDEKGAIRFTGRAAAGAGVRIYVDNQAVGDAGSDGTGQWTLTPVAPVAAGVHTLRVDRLDPVGRVVARVELPFQRTAVPAAELASGRIVVQPGQNLWRMARSAYGSGVRYTVIYLANREQIRDPRLIYPGQAFSIPTTTP